MWGVRTKVIPVVVGALGSIPLRLNDSLRAIEVGIPVGLIQGCALLGSARIRKEQKKETGKGKGTGEGRKQRKRERKAY